MKKGGTICLQDKVYIGTTIVGREKRFKQHARNPPSRMRADVALYSQLGSFADTFVCTLIVQVDTQKQAHKLEKMWIQQYRSTEPDRGYNSMIGHPADERRYHLLKFHGAI